MAIALVCAVALFPETFRRAVVYGLDPDLGSPVTLDPLQLDSHLGFRSESGCRRAAPRRPTPGVSLFCDGLIFGLQWNVRAGELVVADVVERIDRFNNGVPHFEIPRSLA